MLSTVLLTALLASTPAQACGGLFCDTVQPVVQNAERIVFGMDKDTGSVETHVQVFYEGPSEDFAWIVPVPAAPELFVSTQALFDTLALRTAPTFQLVRIDEGRCQEDNRLALPGGVEFDMAASATATSGVQVISTGQVGPYDTVVLKADDADALLSFLDENGYDIPDQLDPVLAPYVARDAHFVALKLQKDKDTGDIAPIGMRYQATKAMIPIQLTSVAATPDMRLEVYVFGHERAVPESYLHVRINEAAIDWWNFGFNYPDVITQAANEAGGHAFATDYAGSSEFLKGSLYVPGRVDRARLRGLSDPEVWVSEVLGSGIPASPELGNVFLDHLDVPSGTDPVDFVNCVWCYDGWQDTAGFDPVAATNDLEVRVLDPLEDAETLFERFPYLSRMTSSLDAVEMTVDPVFVQNPDMTDDEVDNAHSADLVYECGNGRKRDKAPRRLVLEDGLEIRLPSESWFADRQMTEAEFIADLGATKAKIIEQTSGSGEPVVIFDYTEDLNSLTDAFNADVARMIGMGCGCATGIAGGNAAGVALLAGGLLIRRRRS